PHPRHSLAQKRYSDVPCLHRTALRFAFGGSSAAGSMARLRRIPAAWWTKSAGANLARSLPGARTGRRLRSRAAGIREAGRGLSFRAPVLDSTTRRSEDLP